MSIMSSIILRILVISVVVVGISYFGRASYLVALILILCLGLIGEVITGGESMPGQRDNPDGDEIHPFKLIAILAISIITLVLLASYFPSLTEFNAYS
jgi:hypothetical protein